MDIGIDNLIILCFYEFKPLFVVNLKNVEIQTDNFNHSYKQVIQGSNLSIIAIDPLSADHPEFLGDYSSDKSNSITIEMSMLSPKEKLAKNYTYYMGVKLKSTRIKFVKRRLNEVVEFFKNRLLDHLLWEESYIVDGEF